MVPEEQQRSGDGGAAAPSSAEAEAPVEPVSPREGMSAVEEAGPAAADAGPAAGEVGPAAGEVGPAEAEAEPVAAEVEQDLEELVARAARADEYLALAQRTQADFENYRKRAAREARAAEDRGVTRVTRELLPALDNLGRALSAAGVAGNGGRSEPEGAATPEPDLAAGIRLIHDELLAALARVGIEVYTPDGEPFDPQQHEAMAQQPVEGAAPGTVVEVYQSGYRLGGSVLRPARVVVAA